MANGSAADAAQPDGVDCTETESGIEKNPDVITIDDGNELTFDSVEDGVTKLYRPAPDGGLEAVAPDGATGASAAAPSPPLSASSKMNVATWCIVG